MKFVKSFPKFQEHLLFMAISTLPQNLQEAAFKMFGCPSQESLPECKEHLFLLTAFQVYHMYREHRKGFSKFGGVEGTSVNIWGSMQEGLPRKRKISS